MNKTSTVQHISECFIKPKHIPEESKQPVYLATWDLAMPCVHYIQKGLLFKKPPSFDEQNQLPHFLDKLKESLSLTLIHFYPLAGRLATLKQEDPPLYSMIVDCNNSPGARFIQAYANFTIWDILSPTDVPVDIVQAFFDHDRAINHDGHGQSLLSIQVNELIDGIFIGCSLNHMIGDGTSYWHFFNSWSEIFKANEIGKDVTTHGSISRPPIHKRWFPEGYGPILSLPYTHHDQFIIRHESPILRERFFHFSNESLAKLKSKANVESGTTKISSLQALSALIWRCVTRVRRFPPSQVTSCRMAINNRTRLNPPLHPDYFGNCIQTVKGTATANELLVEHNNLGWPALLLHEAILNHKDHAVREIVDAWVQNPFIYQLGQFFDPCSVMMGSSPRFDMYGNEFGLGKAVALRSGYANKFDGKVSLYPGYEGGNSMDLEICLLPENMAALECDPEFMESVNL
ncbi:hypothetical protein Leryth_023245 [Lithospermum erythrorhizon]|nr:hypothetical protein Leryth_023245 [Lithospermum erythrorhizon]